LNVDKDTGESKDPWGRATVQGVGSKNGYLAVVNFIRCHLLHSGVTDKTEIEKFM